MRPRYRLRPDVLPPHSVADIASLPPGVVYDRFDGLAFPLQRALAQNPDWYDVCVDYLLQQDGEEEVGEGVEQDNLYD